MTAPARVLIADAEPPTRRGLRLAVERAGFEVCAEAATAGRAAALALSARPDACLVDAGLPGDGIVAATRIAEAVPATSIVVVAHAADGDELLRALSAGAVGYLLPDADPDRLPATLHGVLGGEVVIPRALVRFVLDELQAGPGRRRGRQVGDATLTPREWEILKLLGDHRTTSEIAEQLAVSPVTVRRHVSGVLAKLGASDRASAVRMASGAPA